MPVDEQIGKVPSWELGFTLPGYKYCGPLNSEDLGEPVNPLDAACLEHDKGYGELIKRVGEKRTYTEFNEADQKLLDRVADIPLSVSQQVVFNTFALKKRFAKHMEVELGHSSKQGSESSKPVPPAPSKRPRDSSVKSGVKSSTRRRIRFGDGGSRRPMYSAATLRSWSRYRRSFQRRVSRHRRQQFLRRRRSNRAFNRALRRSFAYSRNHSIWRRYRHPSTFAQWNR